MSSNNKQIQLSFLIPAYNDEETIEKTVIEARDTGRKISSKFEIVVINDTSPDKTGEQLRRLERRVPELRVLTHTSNKGYGGTIKDLYYAGKYEWMFTTPGDYQIPPKEIIKLLPYIDEADMIIGWRVNRNDPPERLRQSLVYNTLLKILYGISLHDINSVRLMKKDMMKSIKLTTVSAFVDAELTIRAIRQGFKVIEKPVAHLSRYSGEETAGGGKLKTILPVIKDMIVFRLTNI